MSKFQATTDCGRSIFECSSAMQKAVRRGLEDDALYFAVELDRSGYGEYAFKRLRIIASEDVGLAEPLSAVTVRSLYDNYKDLKTKKDEKYKPERMFLVHAVLYLVRAKKSRMVDNALCHYYHSDEYHKTPDYAFDMHTKQGKAQGKGIDHFFSESSKLENESTINNPYKQLAYETLKKAEQKLNKKQIENLSLFH